MSIVVAMDSFKGCVEGLTASRYVAWRLRLAGKDAVALPLADGGEGTSQALSELLGGRALRIPTCDAYGEATEARVTLLEGGVAAVDVAACCGLGANEGTNRARVMRASTFGLGLLLKRLVKICSPRQIILGLGGSATCDGGLGMLQALGAGLRWLTSAPQRAAAMDLKSVAGVDLSTVAPMPPILLLCDVKAPLTGAAGAARRFAPQKGASAAEVEELEAGLSRWAAIMGVDGARPGMGAAGGIPVAALALGAEPVAGADFVTELLEPRLESAEMVITGEGRTDEQTLQGKGPFSLMRRCAEKGIDTHLISGALTVSVQRLREAGFRSAQALSGAEPTAFDMDAKVTMRRMAAAAQTL